jgi:methyl-accepting chemotaxis protein
MAAAQLRRSIEEIGLQVDRSTAMTGKVVSDVRRTNGIVGALAQSAQSIGEVVGLITKITSQTKRICSTRSEHRQA